MFEAHVLHLLRRYLGEYVEGLSVEALRISVWKGDVVLKDLKLKADALNSLKLPVTVKAGFIGTITLKVPWKSLGKEPVIVLIDRVFILAHPVTDGSTLNEDRDKLYEAKLQEIEEAESATLEALSKSKIGSQSNGNSWLGSLIATIIGNLKISISNVHIRYEDSVSKPGHPFCSGATLAKLAAVTMDEEGKETFDTSGAVDKLRKSVQLERLAVYHDSDSAPWKINKRWEELTPKEWVEIFEEGIHEPVGDHSMSSKWERNHTYLVSPINGDLKYHRVGNQERNDPEVPFENASLVLSDVSLTVTEAQYHDWIKLLEVVSKYKRYVEFSHLRPALPVSEGPYLWWRYAAQAGLQQKKLCYRFSWDRIRLLCQLRRRYIQLYAGFLQHLSNVDNAEIREIERDLDSKVIILWRLLAHAKVESVKSNEAAEKRMLQKKSWFSFRWRAPDESAEEISEGSQSPEERLTKEEWQAINKLLSNQPDDALAAHSGKEMRNMIRFMVTVSVNRAAARIVDINKIEILCCKFEQLQVSTKFKHQSTDCDVSLRLYGLYAPEGSLAQSVSSERKVNALTASFVYSPVGENVDWRLSATTSPCHVTVLMESCDRVLDFVKRSNAVSPTVTLETATALQMQIEKVTRKAQEQFQMVLEEQSRFALDIDLDAPKVRIPIRSKSTSNCDSHFLLDLGHFTLQTKDTQNDEQKSLYSRFLITGRDIAAFFTDCGSSHQTCSLQSADSDKHPPVTTDSVDNFCPLIDRCGMGLLIDQIKVPHPSLPSLRVSIQVPNLGMHFSPSRFQKLMKLLNLFCGPLETDSQPAVDNFQHAPWSPADLYANARILIWKGIGNSVATWKPCFLVLSGTNIFVLESEKSQSYQRCSSMAGRQVCEVPETSIGGSPFCLAVIHRGIDMNTALESSSSLIIEFHGEEEKIMWLKGLTQATYQASAPASVDVLGKTIDHVAEFGEPQSSNSETADLVVNGALLETKLCIYGKAGGKNTEDLDENLILEVLARGGQVHMTRREGDMALKTKLRSLKIKDELQDCLSTTPQYLAYSVLKSDNLVSSPGIVDPHWKKMSVLLHEEDDTFADALPDFLSVSDVGFGSPLSDAFSCVSTEDISDSAGFTFAFEKNLVKEKFISAEEFYETEDNDYSDFVSVTFSTLSLSSPDYNGIDTQMGIRMSKLEFFCNRPTLVALIDFGLDLSNVYSAESTANITGGSGEKSVTKKEKIEEVARVKGLLGYGKGRVVFYLNMNVDSVTVFLNKEDASLLATFVQESFVLDLKVHPSSLSLEGTLGNFRLRDMSLQEDNCWAWLCDIRNPDVESLIKFNFTSYSADDDDYEGYDYSLCGRFAAVRIVFLYRFVQEITAYFMELATPHTEEAINLVDKVGGFEWLIEKNEIDGASALKLDLSLDNPIIIVPRNSTSNDFIQLDLGQLQVTNEFSWHGSSEKDPSAVHIDVLHAEILGINMSVGIEGRMGKSMIREGKGFDIDVRRSLRDIFKKVPTFSLEVKVGILHCVMSDKEYKVILDCASTNLCEEPKLPPSFRSVKSDSKDKIRLLVNKVNTNSQILLSRTVTIVAVLVDHALLELYNCIHAESPFAQIALEGLWVSYRMTSLSETDLYITISKFSVVDIRPDTKPEMRLMLGSSTDAFKQVSSDSLPFFLKKGSFRRTDSSTEFHGDAPVSTMLLMDYRCRTSTQLFVVRIQQPRVLVVADFLLAVGEFFVPALGSITGREEVMDSNNDPIGKNSNIVLTEPTFKQIEDVVHLSQRKQLVADFFGIDEYTYDGCGKTVHLSEEVDAKELNSTTPQPIIIIGRGKRLRFMNVKVENGPLLRRYTYLNNDSSYSVSFEDGVDIELLETSSCDDDDKKSPEYMHESPGSSTISDADSDPNKIPSFSFETQVVSPEFTFYDGSKSSLDDSFGEKLLRAKLDFSFMYASKEKDTWVRALVKDLTIETGSGLVVLDPVDISGGYTSVKEKTSMSLLSTDICFHLSLSAISLMSNLQSQGTSAWQYGNSAPLAPCTNFDRIWVSPKEYGSCFNLTFWRPRAPSNYVILGDCVTSKPIPPSQAVMAVSNTYGRVCKPAGFNLIGLFSAIQGYTGGASDISTDCSLWMPIAPPGYTALGSVANIGNEPPPNHIVYCIRSDLITSTTFIESLFCSPSNPHYTSGFSIWRVENVLGSFYAHSSTECPSREKCCNLNHLLLWNSSRHGSSAKETATDPGVAEKSESQERGNQAHTSGWDVVRSVSKATKCYMSTPNFERIWWEKGSDIRRPVSIWRPIPRRGYAILGDCITEGLEPPAVGIIFRADDPEISAKPVQFTKVAHVVGKGLDEAFFWYPIAPPGYASVGCIVSRIDEPPSVNSFCCPRMDLVNQANILEVPISRSSASKGSQCWSIWRVENQACTFLARGDLMKPSSRLGYAIGDSMKPKTRENITAEVKLRSLSVTILDSLCGMMTPLFDTTITNIKLATHGRMEAMNAVLISSMAASTFNTQLEAWEPLVEPFDGIFKFETYDTSLQSPSEFGKTVRIASTNVVNINVSAANLETLIGAILSWRRQLDLEQKAKKINEEAHGLVGKGEGQTLSALDDNDFQTVIVENKLGCDIYLKKVEQNTELVNQLHSGNSVSVWVPPPRFSDRLNVADESKEARSYVAIQIHEAKGLPIIDDGNSHNFLCALRLVVDSQAADQQKLFPQSARTKCVKPSVLRNSNLIEGSAEWNELFIFEVPRKGPAKLEVEVTNLAAKAGKGEVVGALSFSVGQDANMFKKLASVKDLHQGHDIQSIVSHPLKRTVQQNQVEDPERYGCLLVSTSYFERTTTPSLQRDLKNENLVDRDIGFYIGMGPEVVSQSIRALLPLSVVPILFQDNYIALEVMLKNGKKHAIFRGLATIVNETDIKLKISICGSSRIQAYESSSGTSGIDISAINPGSSFVLPWKSTSSDSDSCLQICPFIDHLESPYSWGSVVAVGSGYASGKNLTVMDEVSLSREYTSKQENKMPNVSFRLNQLEKKDVLLCCTSTVNEQLWLSVGADASVLHTEFNAPVYDWRVSVNSPIKLENRLPCSAEFTIWEMMKEGKSTERAKGMISSRGAAHIYSIDIQKPIYLTLFVQGGWVMEKGPILALNLYSNDHVSSFWMVHQKSKRRLRVSIERDMGGTTAAPKIIRFFVPYWIINDSSISLAYRVVEVEPVDNAEPDSQTVSRAGKSAKTAFKSPTYSLERKHSAARRNIQVLDVIEDTSPVPNMLSTQDYTSLSGATLFSSHKDLYPSSRVGLSVAIRHSEIYSSGISLHELEKKERLDVKAFSSDGSYYRLSARLNMTSDRTKVVHFQPRTLFVNRVGYSLCLQQCDSQAVTWIHPTDSPKPFCWQSGSKVEMLKLRVDGYKWSTPFSVCNEGVMRVRLGKDTGNDQLLLRVGVRSGAKNSSLEVIFRPNSILSPYRIENRSMFLPIRIRQVDGTSDSWTFLLPNSAASFLWEDLGRRRLLEMLVEGADPLKSEVYDIDEISDHQPIEVGSGPSKALRVTIVKEDKFNVIKISDWMPENEPTGNLSRMSVSQLSKQQQTALTSDSEFHIIVELPELGISLIDHTPEEILYLSIQNLLFAYSTGLGYGVSRLKLRMRGIQLDNQLPLTPMPVLFRPQRIGEEMDDMLKFSVTMQSNGSLDLCVYPYIGLHGPENSAFLINVHEPIIWRLHEMIQQVNFSRLYDTQTTAVSIDPIVEIGVLNISEVRFKMSMTMSPSQRPRGVLGFWASLMTALGNTENMAVRINQRFLESVCMRQSSMISVAISNIQKDLLGQPLQLLSGVDILGNASSALGHMSRGVAALSFDKKFIQGRQKQESKGVEDLGDVIREGGGALAKGFFRGITGIVTKPLEGAKSSGVEGFVQGFGKGLIGAAAQPVSGVLDLFSKTTEGANALRMKIAAAITSEDQLLRRRLPRVIGGDNLLKPYEDYKAQGQAILQLAQSGSFFLQVDLFNVRGKFALSDAYEDHFLVRKGKVVVVTHRRVLLLQQPNYTFSQKRFNPASDSCSVVWDVLLDDLVTMELAFGKKDHPKAPHSKLILYLHDSSATEMREQTRVIKCIRDRPQALEVYTSIERAMSIYGPNKAKERSHKSVTKPYSPLANTSGSEVNPKDGLIAMSPRPLPLPPGSIFGRTFHFLWNNVSFGYHKIQSESICLLSIGEWNCED